MLLQIDLSRYAYPNGPDVFTGVHLPNRLNAALTPGTPQMNPFGRYLIRILSMSNIARLMNAFSRSTWLLSRV
jgi:hypothetical protein